MTKRLNYQSTKGVCYNCLNGAHDCCNDKTCTCKAAKHKVWWWDDISEMQEQIHQWAEKAFGKPMSNLQIAIRANQEMSELLMKLCLNDTDKEAIEESADVVICLYRLVNLLGGNLDTATAKKMEINKKRKWNTQGNGIGQHKDPKTKNN